MKAKSIIKRSLAFLLAIMTIMSVGLTNIIALSIEMVETRWSITKTVYYIDTDNWGSCWMHVWQDGGGFGDYDLSTVTNTNNKIYYYSSGWNNYSGFMFMKDKSYSKQTGNIHENVSSPTWYYGTTPNKITNVANVNAASKVVTMISTDGGNTYSATANSDTYTKISGYNLAVAGNTSTTDVSEDTKTSNSATINAVYGSNVTITAVPGDAIFKGFSTNATTAPSGTTTNYTKTYQSLEYNGSSNTTYYAYYILNNEYTFTVTAGTGGSIVTPANGSATVEAGQSAEIEAEVSVDGYEFDKWTTDGNGTFAKEDSLSTTFTPAADDEKVTATFKLKNYPVKAEARPEGAGTVSINPSSVTHGSTATLKVDSTNAGYKFNHWEDADGNTLDSTTVTVTGEATYYAVFDTLTPYQVTITDHGIPADYNGETQGHIGTFKINDYPKTAAYTATLYEDDTITFYSQSYQNHYVSSLIVNGDECVGEPGVSSYYPESNYWTVGKTIKIGPDTTKDNKLTIDVYHHLNPKLSIDGAVETEGIGTISAKKVLTTSTITYNTTPKIVDYKDKAITYSASTSNGAYYLAKVYDKNTGEVYFTNSDPTIKSVTDRELPAVDADVCLSATFLLLETKKVTVNLTGVAAGVAEATVEGTGSFIKNDDGTFSVAKGTEFKVTVNVPENGAYYIGSFDGASISDQKTFTKTKTFTVEKDTTLDVSILARKKYLVTITNPDETQGTLVPVGDTTVYHGGSLTIKATPKDGYVISKWVVDGKETDNNNSEITLQNITSTRTVSIIWEESKEIKISGRAYPRAAGNVTITGFSGNYQQDAIAGKVYTFTVADVDSAVYEFTNWSFTGKIKLVEEEGNTLTSKTIKIIALEDLTAVANYDQVARRIYAPNYTHAYYWSGANEAMTTWPGVELSTFKGMKSVVVPLEAEYIILSNNGNSQTGNLTYHQILDKYASGWTTSGYTVKIGSTSYFLTEREDGTFRGSLTTTGNVTGTVYKNGSTINVATTTTGITEKSMVTFIYNPDDNSLTYNVKVYSSDTLEVYVDNGAKALMPGDTVSDNLKSYAAVGQTTLDPESEGVLTDPIISYCDYHGNGYLDTGYYKYTVGDGLSCDIVTNLTAKMAGTYKVAGYVINATEFVVANKLSSTKYTTSYTFEQSDEKIVVVPVYQYSDEYINKNNLARITLYVQKPSTFTGNWNTDYMAAYLWYDNESGDRKYLFGDWPGQIMIPTTTGDGDYWYTEIVTSLPGGYVPAGITFSNYGGWGDKSGVMSPVTETTNVQVYDYYEFVSLANKQSKNITFVLKDGKTDNGTSFSSSGKWEVYQNIDKENADIFGEATESTETGLYIMRNAPVEYKNDDVLDGYFYVDCYVYKNDTNHTFLGKFKSYELLQLSDTVTSLTNAARTSVDFTPYRNKLVQIDYEVMTNTGYGDKKDQEVANRYDGQWYDEVKQVTINVKVAQVGVDETDYTKYTVSTTNPGNEDTYGKASVNGIPGGKIDRDSQLKLIAQPQSGFKFVGWYNAETKQLVSKQREYTEGTAVAGATFIAVFQPLKEGSFTINHNLYTGAGDGYTPLPLEGKGKLYIGVEYEDGTVIEKLDVNNSVSFDAQEGTTYVIKIATDPDLLDEFDAWYVQTKDKYGRVTYEEIGMDNFGEYGNLHDNGDTVVGRNDKVFLTFKHTVEKDEEMTIDIYSNIKKKDDKITLYYRYNDRSNVTRTVTVKYQLTDEYIAQYGREPHNGLIYELAPYVDDYYTNVTWVINKDKFNESAYILWATQEPPTYTVTVSTGSSNLVYPGNPYNTLVEVNASDLGAKSDKGYWIEINKDGTTGQVVAYGRYYGLRVTKDVTLKYIEDENIDFKVVLDAPVYTREQSGVVGEPGYVDQVLTDYMTSIHVPLFVGDVTANGDKITTTIFNDQAYVNANSPVTLETLVYMGYKFEYGVILEECRNADDMGKESDTTVLQKYVDKKSGFNDDNNKTRYGTTYNLTDKANITNKNRFLYTVKFNNTEANQNRNFNVYGYIKVTSNVKDAQPVYYFSELQTLNIKEYGNKVGNDQVGSDIVDE